MAQDSKKTLGLALSGSGVRTNFYIGFLEVFDEQKVPIDYLAASSGGALVASAYACGTLPEFKKDLLGLNIKQLKQYVKKSLHGRGFYSLDGVEEALTKYTKGQIFENVKPRMVFTAADIVSGEAVDLCMGDIAHAACVSCTLPGIFEPIKWGSRTLVDGGLISEIPLDLLKKFNPDISVGLNMQGTKFIFHKNLINFKSAINFFKKAFFFDEVGEVIGNFFKNDNEIDIDESVDFGYFSVVGKSLDMAIKAKKNKNKELKCDLMIDYSGGPDSRNKFTQKALMAHYEEGRKAAIDAMPKIKELLEAK